MGALSLKAQGLSSRDRRNSAPIPLNPRGLKAPLRYRAVFYWALQGLINGTEQSFN